MSKLFNLNWQDIVKGVIMAVGSAVLTTIYQALTAGGAVNWHDVATVAASALVAYLLKNIFTTEDGKFLGKI